MEWDNQRLAATSRAAACLGSLGRQLATPVPGYAVLELLVVHDPAMADGEALGAFVRASLGGDVVPVALVPAPGASYYEMKNLGARQARGEVLAFVDSDVVPEAGWLAALLGALAEPGVRFAAGHTFVAPATFLDRAYGPAWIFPARSAAEAPYAVTPGCGHGWHANNFALGRDFFLASPFVPEPGRNRGACTALGDRLRAAGVTLLYIPAARATHPTPNGWRHTLAWWMNHGREIVPELGPPRGPIGFVAQAAFQTAKRVAWAWRNLVRDRKRVGLAWYELPAAIAIMSCFHLLHFPGMLWGRYAPQSFNRHFIT